MSLKSTNIWDDVREENAEEDCSHPLPSPTRRGSSSQPEDQNESCLGITDSHHANRHGVSMKSLTKNR